eukprot:NODE_5990_length_538_cov_279.581781.p1 GENE.NODE_5990_length_538_cov_279.581781~~NODE_5990_length_538_cov_279.581781.p1  ORF type:complete len:145 (+),score=42.59 NODE_5990_length_538_cov_279.581781:3-437(+)
MGEEKWGYDKSWEWHGDTPLTAAARSGHVAVVKTLLLEGADPTLECCPSDDVYETPLKAAETRAQAAKADVEAAKKGELPSYRRPRAGSAALNAEELLRRCDGHTAVIAMLKAAEAFWSRASYSHARYTVERRTGPFTNQLRHG